MTENKHRLTDEELDSKIIELREKRDKLAIKRKYIKDQQDSDKYEKQMNRETKIRAEIQRLEAMRSARRRRMREKQEKNSK